ncbi:MAG: hypothetical protein LBD07_06210 [Spirochaetaceae bacterium]|nr:hypothetical protein [Spirochaetaceae bacterium]
MSETKPDFSVEHRSVSFVHRIMLWGGVIRRFFLFVFNRKYITQSVLNRRGECSRCGACCKLALRVCPCLKMHEDGSSSCEIHGAFRMPNCVIFPIDHNDIQDRNRISPHPCGYSFE